MRLMLLLFLVIIFSIPSSGKAQILDSFSQNAITLDVSPANPQPNELVEITLNDYSSGISGISVRWSINGVNSPNFENSRKITIPAGAVGSQTDIRADIMLPSGLVQTATYTIKPIYLDIIVEPQTHVPDFFMGRALASVDSTVNLTALLSDGSLLGSNFIYTWRINDQVFEGGPLRGRNKISFQASQDSFNTVSLQVSNLSGEIIARRSVFVPTVSPKVVFYENDPLYGMSSKTIKAPFIVTSNTITITSEPYYLNSATFNYPDILEWQINSSRVSGDTNNPYNLTLEATGFSGTARINFRVQNTTQFLQGARGAVNISI